MMYTYLGILKKGVKYDDDLESYLTKNNVTVVKFLGNLDILIIQSEKRVTVEDFTCFETLEMEKNDFSI
jgi:hypothetical protein